MRLSYGIENTATWMWLEVQWFILILEVDKILLDSRKMFC